MPHSPITIATTLASRWWREAIVDRFRLWSVRIEGVEVTQAIQYYRAASHLTDPNDRFPDNSITLVANKAAWVRVSVRSGLLGSVAGVTGTLQIERRRLGFFFDPITTITPQPPGTITAQQNMDYATERGNVANTLNFIIPAATFSGNMRLTVRLTNGAGREYDTQTFMVRATLQQTLRLRAILVSYNGPSTAAMPGPGQPPPPNIQLAAPSLANLQTTAAIALRAMPVQATGDFASAGTTLPWSLPLDDPRSGAGQCSTNWGQLLTALANRRTSDGNRNDVVYYGLLPAGIPLNVPGCGNNGLGAGAVGDQPTLLHEIGHGYGFQHTPCGAAGATDPSFPIYEPYASASIGEYGLDISNGNVFSPQTARDYMSYCFPQWMSLYQHDRLIGHTRLDPRWITDEPWWVDYLPWKDYVIPDLWLPDPPPYEPWRRVDVKANPIISITGIVQSSKQVEVTTVARVMAAGMPPGAPTRLMALLYDDSGRPIAHGTLFQLSANGGCGCDGGGSGDPNAPPYAFQVFLPDTGPGAALRIMDGDEEIWSRRAPDSPPQIGRLEAYITEGHQLELRWHAETAVERPEVWVQWSGDGGKNWHGLATGLSGSAATVDLTGLPDGGVLVRVLVHDGFFTSVSEPAHVNVPLRAPEIAILHPNDGQTLYAGRTLHLWGAATNATGQPLPDESCCWLLDDCEVARGKKDAWLETPVAGEHQATFVVRWSGGETACTVRFTTIGDHTCQPKKLG